MKNNVLFLKRFFVLTLLFTGVAAAGNCQEMKDTLREVNVVREKKTAALSQRLNGFNSGQKTIAIDSQTLAQYEQQSVAILLAQQVPVFVKSYGFNGLATLQFRGASSAQSAVYWKGIPLANAALGVADVSLLPTTLFDEIQIIYGGSAALWGSGNVGGAVMLGNAQPTFDSSKKINGKAVIGGGGFGQWSGGLKLNAGGRKWDFAIQGFLQKAKNDFPYKKENGGKSINTNAALKSLSEMATLSYKASNADVAQVSVWYQHYEREIPPAFFEASSHKNRTDKSIRTVLSWEHNRRTNWYAKLAWFQDFLDYSDSAIHLFSSQKTQQYFGEAGLKIISSRRHQLLLFAPVQIAVMPASKGFYRQEKYALAAAYSYQNINRTFSGALNARAENIDGKSIFLPGINASWQLAKPLQLKANLQKTYRAPTLNERFYNPGGNPTLKPEKGWSADAGYKLHFSTGSRIKWEQEVSVFNRRIENWILWFGGAIWTPHNISSVKSSGIEIANSLSFTTRKNIFHLKGNWSYVRSKTMESALPNDGSIGRQIPYTPFYNAQINGGISAKHFYANGNFTYTGYRFINVDETGFLPSYSLLNLQLQWYFLLAREKRITLSAQGNNLLNKNYQVVNGRPMPGINWLAGLGCSF